MVLTTTTTCMAAKFNNKVNRVPNKKQSCLTITMKGEPERIKYNDINLLNKDTLHHNGSICNVRRCWHHTAWIRTRAYELSDPLVEKGIIDRSGEELI